jgi:hypothetical protein
MPMLQSASSLVEMVVVHLTTCLQHCARVLLCDRAHAMHMGRVLLYTA